MLATPAVRRTSVVPAKVPANMFFGWQDFRRVHSWVIRQSAAEPDGPGVDAPVTPTFIRRSNAEPDEPLINKLFCPTKKVFLALSDRCA